MGHNRDLGYVKAFGKHLKKLRLAKRLSQEELSYKCGFPLSQIGRFERGDRSPTPNTIKFLAQGLSESQGAKASVVAGNSAHSFVEEAIQFPCIQNLDI